LDLHSLAGIEEDEERDHRSSEEIEVIYRALKEFKPYRAENETDLGKQLIAYLRGKVPYEVTPQKAGARSGNIGIPDIVVGNVAIEIKYFDEGKGRTEWDKAIGQTIRYKLEGNYDTVVLFVIDKKGIVPEYYKEYEELIPWLKVIVK